MTTPACVCSPRAVSNADAPVGSGMAVALDEFEAAVGVLPEKPVVSSPEGEQAASAAVISVETAGQRVHEATP